MENFGVDNNGRNMNLEELKIPTFLNDKNETKGHQVR
jgi:hypothetical protein